MMMMMMNKSSETGRDMLSIIPDVYFYKFDGMCWDEVRPQIACGISLS